MNDLFNSIYYYTNDFYDSLLDDYLYETVPGYLHVGLMMLCCSFVVCAIYYYILAPVRRQMTWWFVYSGINAVINFVFAVWYTYTPLINNEIEQDKEWSYLDATMFSITNVLWSFLFFVLASLIIKWWSTAKYIPFKKF